MQPPTENAVKLARLFRRRQCLGQELTKSSHSLGMTLRDLVIVSEMLVDVERTEMAKVVALELVQKRQLHTQDQRIRMNRHQ